jgi:hypothetical protein
LPTRLQPKAISTAAIETNLEVCVRYFVNSLFQAEHDRRLVEFLQSAGNVLSLLLFKPFKLINPATPQLFDKPEPKWRLAEWNGLILSLTILRFQCDGERLGFQIQ